MALLIWGGVAAAREGGTAAGDPVAEDSWGSYIEGAQRAFSGDIVQTGRWLDGFFGSDVLDADQEGSVLRLGFSTELKRGGLQWEPEVRLQLELPRTEKRFNFYLESTVEDAFTADESEPVGVAAAVDPAREEDEDDFIAGFEYVDSWAEFLNFRAGAGVIVQWPPNPFTRMRIRRSFFLGDWQLRLGQELFWSHDRGPGTETEMLWQHPMDEVHFFRAQTDATYLERDDTVYYGQQFLISRRLAPRQGLLYRLAFYSQSDEGTPFTRVVYDLRWRRPVYSDWVLMELRPGFDFPRDEDFEMQPRVFLTVEALFGDRQEYEY
ncbi:hypothetical protein H0Z60_07680 [Ectothiorhodospiraceae bacterium WFHF3C12]|nr:hypothetical protein [Ectothiorhodospiraceae bacterium WFHF3C12]